jgi:ligand-binding sensor domain-containing protein
MKKTYSILLLFLFVVSCNGQETTKTVGISNTSDPASDIVSAALKDKNGNIWFAASGRGVYRYDGKSFANFTEKDGLSSNDVSCIYEDNIGKLWFGTSVGVCYYDGKTFINFPIATTDSSNAYSSKDYYSQIPKQVGSIIQDKIGNFWFITLNNGVYRYDGKYFTNFLSHEVLVCILEDKAGNIWVGSWAHGGVYRYDGKSFTHFNGLSDDMIKCLLEDKNGNIWIGTRNNGVDRYDGKTIINFSKEDGLCNNDVSCIFEDKNENIWFGSNFPGVGICSYNGKSFTNIIAKEILTDKEGWLYSVMTITQDNDGHLWLGSRGGYIFRYDGKSFTDFSEKVFKQH